MGQHFNVDSHRQNCIYLCRLFKETTRSSYWCKKTKTFDTAENKFPQTRSRIWQIYKETPISKRIGKCCSLNQVEDEEHLFCISPFFDSKRYMFFKYIIDLVPPFITLDDSAKMIWLMTCKDTDIIFKRAEFVYNCF